MTDEVDLGGLVYDGGFFLMRERAGLAEPFAPHDVDARRPYRHIFTYPGSGNTIKKAAVELIRSARDKVFVASFLLGETDLLDALFDTAERLRGGVYVISELSDRSLRQKLTELEDSPDPDSAIRAHKKNFAELTRHGVAVRGHPDCHAKFIVVDDRAALVSSANLDTNGLNTNGENGVVVTVPFEVERLARFYTRLWDSSAYEMPAGSEDYSVREHTSRPSRCDVPPLGTAARSGIIWTHYNEQLIREHLHDVIGRARQSVLLATYSLNGLTGHRDILLDLLQRTIREHSLRVWLLCRGRNNVRSQRDDADALHDLGVHIYADSLNHAKGVIADSQYGALFSANFDAEHGLLNGVETGIRLDGQPALAEAERYFGHAMVNADLEFARRPTQRQMDKHLAIRWRTAWPCQARMRITASPEIWQRFRASAKTPPVLYSREPRGRIRLYAADDQWLLSDLRDDGTRTLEPAQNGPSWAAEKVPQNSGRLLEYWLSPPRRHNIKNENAPSRGFCPATLIRD